MRKTILLSILLIIFVVNSSNLRERKLRQRIPAFGKWWDIQSIDTMKYSRDLAREKLNDTSFYPIIDMQIKSISQTGATHVAIATPYDQEFLPFLKSWVQVARKYNLNVWFRGNFSGWEGWFGYGPISLDEHKKLTKEFIMNNEELFKKGDIFTPCPECENGHIGDPRYEVTASVFRDFLIDEYKIMDEAFDILGKDIEFGYFSMNGDVATLIMDEDTTAKLGGEVVIDHYVKEPTNLDRNIYEFSEKSGGRVVLGEFGAPIKNIHGEMDELEQAEWLSRQLILLAENPNVYGINYWTSYGGSTSVFNENGSEKKAALVLSSFYKPMKILIKVVNDIGIPLAQVEVKISNKKFFTDKDGYVQLSVPDFTQDATLYKDGFKDSEIKILEGENNLYVLEKADPNIIYKGLASVYNWIGLEKLLGLVS